MFFHKPEIIDVIEALFKTAIKKQWYKTYWAFDLHQTILKPDYKRQDITCEFYPFAKETLQILTKRPDIILIMFTATPPDKLDFYIKTFEKNGIKFDFINKNDDINDDRSFGYYANKFYFNVLAEDKAGFKPEYWKKLYKFLKKNLKNYNPDPTWVQKF